MAERFDVVVIGAGPGGFRAAKRCAQRGASVAMVEKEYVGGTCLNWGCIPSKTLLASAHLLLRARHASEMGIDIPSATPNWPKIQQRREAILTGLRKGMLGTMKASKITHIEGHATVIAPRRIKVESSGQSRELEAGKLILATGSESIELRNIPFDGQTIISSKEALSLPQIPQSMLIVGGGVIGCEFATIYSELGIPTTVVEMQQGLLPTMEAEVSRAVTKSLQQRGVQLRLGAQVVAARDDADAVTAELSDGGAVTVSHVLVAVGRPANVEQIGLEKLALAVSNKIIAVDDHCRTGVSGVYAVGDVAELRQYAHLASRMGIVAADNATGNEAADARDVVPIGVYTHPEIAAVGLSEPAARQVEPQVKVSRFPYSASGMAQAYGHAEGMVKLIASPSGRLLGATVIGYGATETIQELALAVRQGLSVSDVAKTIHPHPTFVEAVGEAAQAWLGLPLHSLR
jgi:dihydrolipoamide dehydrogenase